ncbi:cobalamin-binding protein [Paucibacter sp. KBW04]|uniref:MerR family transcriptional regulator n=1 Tax=Paucibacter sp. KBW04 TaxID=2153361 RepID=UPI000F55A6B4|nr:MerR family transcriptional regulator [Paucibacter sp. KBW04]RQO54699.1 cobalamin-binding protein [Paucibacter sp. KBW04]
MADEFVPAEDLMGLPGIASVERDTGIGKDTLRVWERRYGFPCPLRDAQGERAYPLEQVQRLRLLKRLLDRGHRPGRVVPAGLEELESLLKQPMAKSAAPSPLMPGADLEAFVDLLRAHRIDALKHLLSQTLLRLGLGDFVMSVVAPLTTRVGDLWMQGELQVFEEHVYTEALQQVMRQAVQAIPPQALQAQPRVLLTTLPGEPHGLGLLMVEALLALEGCPCVSLGVQTPQQELPQAARAHGADIVALSFTGLLSTGVVQKAMRALRAELPPGMVLWAGGSSPVLRRGSGMEGVLYITELADLAPQLRQWRKQHLADAQAAP